MLNTALCAIMGSLVTTRAETASYLDSITTSNISTSRWWQVSVNNLCDGNFVGGIAALFPHGGSSTWVRIDLTQPVFISSLYLSDRVGTGAWETRLIANKIYLSNSSADWDPT